MNKPGSKKGVPKRETEKVRKLFYEKVSRKSNYLNPEIVETVWDAVLKVVFDGLKTDNVVFLPNLGSVKSVKMISKGFRKSNLRGWIGFPDGVEYYRLKTTLNPRLRRYFHHYLENQKRLRNIVPEKPPTLVE